MAFFLGIKHALEIDKTLSLSSMLYGVYDDGPYGHSPGFNGSASTTLNWKLNERFSLRAPYVEILSPLQSLEDERETNLIYGMGVSYGF